MPSCTRISLILRLAILAATLAPAAAQQNPSQPSFQPGEVFQDCPDCAEMVVVEAGAIEVGSKDIRFESPPHRVRIAKPFAIGRNEVTFREWDLCVAAGACKYRPDDHGWGRGEQPVIDVSWDDVQIFVKWLSEKTNQTYRLPTEAEWEYAARGGTTSPYWWGPRADVDHANCSDCGGASAPRTLPARSFRPNAFGLYDTSGNAAEWVQDCWNESYRGAPSDGSAWTTGDCRQRVLRGGSFGSKSNAVRSSSRFKYDKDVRYYANGFRVVREVK
jgi:formylglycine-generating enzyme required for sulfatase activity